MTAAPAAPDRDAPLPAPAQRSILIVANPTAGGFRRSRLERLTIRLAEAGARARLMLTHHAGEIGEICARPPPGVDTIAVAGGDGSINEAVSGLTTLARPPALAIVPAGTANVLAWDLGIPRAPDRLARLILAGRTAPLHHGLANGRPFVLMASAGFDAAVVHAVPLALKRRFGKLAFVAVAVKLAQRLRLPDLEVTTGADRITCRLAVVTNAARYGGPFRLCPTESPLQPGLHLVAVKVENAFGLVRLGLALVLGRLARTRGVEIRPVGGVRIDSGAAVPCQIDGDTFGVTPLDILPGERPLRVLVPSAA